MLSSSTTPPLASGKMRVDTAAGARSRGTPRDGGTIEPVR